MSGALARRLGRLETGLGRRACPEHHVRIQRTCVAVDGTEPADPEPDPCPACGGALDVLRIELETVPDRARTT
jgi:hypothetical protein